MFTEVYQDREEAGRHLAEALVRGEFDDPVVLGLPRGGVPVAEVVAQRLHAPLDVLVVRKIVSPYQPELAMGAVAEDGTVLWNDEVLQHYRLPATSLQQAAETEMAVVRGRQKDLRSGRPLVSLQGRTAILVDDGLATGATMEAAVLMAQQCGARRVVVAVPVGSQSAIRRMQARGAEVVCLTVPRDLLAVGAYYVDFSPVEDAQVKACLARSRQVEQAPAEDATPVPVTIPVGRVAVHGDLALPPGATTVVIFAHGTGSSRFSPRNQRVAAHLQVIGLGTLLLDLLTDEEERIDEQTTELRFDIDMLAERLMAVAHWLPRQKATPGRRVAYFGASTGAAAALVAAARQPAGLESVVSRGGRPDLAGDWLASVQAPTLLIVGGDDHDVLRLNRQALGVLPASARLQVVPGATHLFEERGTLEQVALLAGRWFLAHQSARLRSEAG